MPVENTLLRWAVVINFALTVAMTAYQIIYVVVSKGAALYDDALHARFLVVLSILALILFLFSRRMRQTVIVKLLVGGWLVFLFLVTFFSRIVGYAHWENIFW